MATEQEKVVFSEKILSQVGACSHSLPEIELSGFLSMSGKNYNRDLMVVGRAVNGWRNGFFPSALKTSAEINEYSSDVLLGSIDNDDCPMSWVTSSWGTSTGYNTKKSAFWRVIRKLTGSLNIADIEKADWPSSIVWSNLYKISPHEGLNPSEKLCNLQQDGCIELLELELNSYKPKIVIFLTGLNWARPFLKALNAKFDETNSYNYVQASGEISVPEKIRFVVASHPQGKKEKDWLNEVLLSLK